MPSLLYCNLSLLDIIIYYKNIIWDCNILYFTVHRSSCFILVRSSSYCTVLYSTVQYLGSEKLHINPDMFDLHHTVLYCTVLYCTVLTILYCTVNTKLYIQFRVFNLHKMVLLRLIDIYTHSWIRASSKSYCNLLFYWKIKMLLTCLELRNTLTYSVQCRGI